MDVNFKFYGLKNLIKKILPAVCVDKWGCLPPPTQSKLSALLLPPAVMCKISTRKIVFPSPPRWLICREGKIVKNSPWNSTKVAHNSVEWQSELIFQPDGEKWVLAGMKSWPEQEKNSTPNTVTSSGDRERNSLVELARMLRVNFYVEKFFATGLNWTTSGQAAPDVWREGALLGISEDTPAHQRRHTHTRVQV